MGEYSHPRAGAASVMVYGLGVGGGMVFPALNITRRRRLAFGRMRAACGVGGSAYEADSPHLSGDKVRGRRKRRRLAAVNRLAELRYRFYVQRAQSGGSRIQGGGTGA